jgi:hypothetical protein
VAAAAAAAVVVVVAAVPDFLSSEQIATQVQILS